MKKILSIGCVFMFMIFITGCKNVVPHSDEAFIDTEIDLEDSEPKYEDLLHDGDCLFTFGSMVVGENLSPEDREWEGYHKLGNEVGKVPTRILFSADGNIKMYTKPMETEDWQLVQNFNIDRMRVSTNDENVDDIIEFPKAVNHCLFEDTEENSSKDFPCITLYPEGAPVQANSPFNVEICINAPGSITADMLKHTFYLSN